MALNQVKDVSPSGKTLVIVIRVILLQTREACSLRKCAYTL